MIDLTTKYLGLTLRSPIVASPGPVTGQLDRLTELSDAGIGAVVLPSLFQEQIEHETSEIDRLFAVHHHSFGEASSFFPELDGYNTGADAYLALIEAARAAVEVPVIASLNGTTTAGWLGHARALEEAGAAAIELNLYSIPIDPAVGGAEVERRTLEIVRQVVGIVKIPVSIKLAPYFSSMSHMAGELVHAGAGRLSRRVCCSLAASRGVETHVEVVKCLLVGADVVMTASALLRNGVQHVGTMREGLERWLGENGFASVEAIRGLKDATHVEHVDALIRAQYVSALTDYLSAPVR